MRAPHLAFRRFGIERPAGHRFLIWLMEAVDSSPRAALVITTTEVTDGFGEQTQEALDAMAEALAAGPPRARAPTE